MANTKRRQSVGEKIGGTLELPLIASPSAAHIELAGNREAVVDGCKGILEYTEDAVCLNLGSVGIRFSGAELCVSSFNCGQAVVCGRFAKIEFT